MSYSGLFHMKLQIRSCTAAQARLLAEFCFTWGCKTIGVDSDDLRQLCAAEALQSWPRSGTDWQCEKVFSSERLDDVARLVLLYFSGLEGGRYPRRMSIHAGRVHAVHNFMFEVGCRLVQIHFAHIYHAEMLKNLGLECELEVTSLDLTSFSKTTRFEPVTAELCQLRWPHDVRPTAECFDFCRWPHPGDFSRYLSPQKADTLILRWWTPSHDGILRRAIEQTGWRMQPPLKELLAITPAEKIAELENVGDSESSYMAFAYFCERRAQQEQSCIAAFPPLTWIRCPICDQHFHQLTVARSGPLKFAVVCAVCRREADPNHNHQWTRAEILDHIRNLHTMSGGRFDVSQSVLETFSADRYIEMVRLWRFQPPRNLVRDIFGSFFAARVAAGVISDEWVRLSRGTRCLARDGHTCLSLGEKVICDWLFENDVPHRREVPYGHECNYIADWEIEGVFVEYFGLMGDARYESKTKKKMEYAEKHGLRLIAIYPQDLKTLEQAFGEFGIGPAATGATAS